MCHSDSPLILLLHGCLASILLAVTVFCVVGLWRAVFRRPTAADRERQKHYDEFMARRQERAAQRKPLPTVIPSPPPPPPPMRRGDGTEVHIHCNDRRCDRLCERCNDL